MYELFLYGSLVGRAFHVRLNKIEMLFNCRLVVFANGNVLVFDNDTMILQSLNVIRINRIGTVNP